MMHSNPLSDEERQELNFLREENKALKKELEEFRRAKGTTNSPQQTPLEESKEHAKVEKIYDYAQKYLEESASKEKPSNLAQKEESSDNEEYEEGPLDDAEFDEEYADCGQLEKRLDYLRARIKRHRLKTGGKCWFYGKGNVELDYGENWDSTSYWNMRISIGGKGNLAGFAYKIARGACDNCKKTTLKMNKAWDYWKKQKEIDE